MPLERTIRDPACVGVGFEPRTSCIRELTLQPTEPSVPLTSRRTRYGLYVNYHCMKQARRRRADRGVGKETMTGTQGLEETSASLHELVHWCCWWNNPWNSDIREIVVQALLVRKPLSCQMVDGFLTNKDPAVAEGSTLTWANVYVCISLSLSLSIYIYIYIYTYIHTYMCVYISLSLSLYIYIYV